MENKKSVLFLMESLGGGGAEKALVELLGNIDYDRYDVTLGVAFNQGMYFNDIPDAVRVCPIYDGPQGRSFKKDFKYYRKYGLKFFMRRRLEKLIASRYDVIVSFMEGIPLLFHSMVCHRGGRNLSWIHCDLSHFHWSRQYFRNDRDERMAYAMMDGVVGCSYNALDGFRRLFALDVPGTVIYNIVDAGTVRCMAGEEEGGRDCMVVTSVGSLSAVKRHDRFLRVARKLVDAGYRMKFQIVGDGALRPELESLRADLGLTDYVSFLGFRKPPYREIKLSDMLVNTSESEGAPLVICEAMALGVPVVATATAGSTELLGGGRYGLITGHSDDEIARGIRIMADNSSLRERFRNSGLERVKEFSAGRFMEQLEKLL